MTIINRYLSLLLLFSIGLFVSCQKESAIIKGSIPGLAGKTVYLEQTFSAKTMLDSSKLSNNGAFTLKHKLRSDDPEFITLKIGSDRLMLLVSKGEKINISGIMNIPGAYNISGSIGSEQLHELNKTMLSSYQEVDSLYTEYLRETNTDIECEDILRKISQQYLLYKQQNARFVNTHATQLIALPVLYQKFPNGMAIFDTKKDILLFKMVADSLKSRYPNSVYVKSLIKDIEQQNNQRRVTNMLLSSLSNSERVASPEINLPDMHQKNHRLSDLKGKVVILTFWTTNSSNMLNREYLELYETYKSKGLEIYQVSLDVSKLEWVTAITTQKLPWISVCDFTGINSIAAKTYNITTVPYNYILDREGNIVSKNIWGDDLSAKLKQLL